MRFYFVDYANDEIVMNVSEDIEDVKTNADFACKFSNNGTHAMQFLNYSKFTPNSTMKQNKSLYIYTATLQRNAEKSTLSMLIPVFLISIFNMTGFLLYFD